MSGTTLTAADAIARPARRNSSRMRLYVRRFLRNKPAVVGLAVFLGLIAFAVFGNFMTKWTYLTQDVTAFGKPPSSAHRWGTSTAGIDVFAMVVHGLGRSLVIGLSVSALTLIIAAFLGAIAAYVGGRVESIILGAVNFLLACPAFLLMCIVAQATGGAWAMIILVLTLFGWMLMARVIWQLSTSIREREFVVAARFMGIKGWVVALRHIVPNIGSLLVVEFTLGIVYAVMSETALSFLGFGIHTPDVSLGSILAAGQVLLTNTPWVFWPTAAALLLLTLSVGFMADGLRDALDPTSAAGGKA